MWRDILPVHGNTDREPVIDGIIIQPEPSDRVYPRRYKNNLCLAIETYVDLRLQSGAQRGDRVLGREMDPVPHDLIKYLESQTFEGPRSEFQSFLGLPSKKYHIKWLKQERDFRII